MYILSGEMVVTIIPPMTVKLTPANPIIPPVALQGNYVKDLTKIDRDINNIIIVDNSPLSYMFQPENAIGCST